MTSHRQFYAGYSSLMAWCAKLQVGDLLVTGDGQVCTIRETAPDKLVVQLADNSCESTFNYDSFAKLALECKLQRICRNCKRTRKEHLKKAKCLFGATKWS